MQGWKSVTARWMLATNGKLSLGIPDPHCVWMREYWDRYIRDGDHYRSTVNYILQNPVKAGLCKKPEDWPWSSGNAGNANVPVGMVKDADEDVGAPGGTGAPGTPLRLS